MDTTRSQRFLIYSGLLSVAIVLAAAAVVLRHGNAPLAQLVTSENSSAIANAAGDPSTMCESNQSDGMFFVTCGGIY